MSVNRASRVLAKIGLEVSEAARTLEEGAALKEVIKASVKASLLGAGPSADAEVSQWLSFARSEPSKDGFSKLNNFLSTKSYLATNKFTIADVSVFVAVQDNYELAAVPTLPALSRWYNHIQRLTVDNGSASTSVAATVFPASLFASSSSSSSPAAVETTAAANDAPPVPPAAAAPAVPAPEAAKAEKPEKSDKKDKKAAKEGAPAAEKKGDTPPTVLELDPSRLEILVGLVVKCWNHPESDKLLCEEIDLGEGTTRTIASGLRAHYTAEEVQGRKVVVLANLKERPMAGFKSQGMVLCAVGEGHSVVKLLVPPADAAVGERVLFPGFNGEPAPATQVAKKKILEGLAPGLRTDENGVAHWTNSPFTLAGGVCRADLSNAVVS